MSLAGSPWWVIAQGILLGGIGLNVVTLQNYRLGMTLALVSFALTFMSHDVRGRHRKHST